MSRFDAHFLLVLSNDSVVSFQVSPSSSVHLPQISKLNCTAFSPFQANRYEIKAEFKQKQAKAATHGVQDL